MPQLPSGRHVALDPSPLNQLIDDVLHERTLAHWPLLAIESPNDCLKHIEINYMEPVLDVGAPNLAKGSLPIDSTLRQVRTGLTVENVLADASDWSREDKEFFCDFLSSERVRDFLDNHFENIKQIQASLREDGSFLQKWQAQTWAAGCHPIQNDFGERDKT